MALYSQIIIWGQSAICLAVCILLDLFGFAVAPPLVSAMIPLGKCQFMGQLTFFIFQEF